ncbi:protein of unknown function, partial [Taphrina deformans PYCC 5710]
MSLTVIVLVAAMLASGGLNTLLLKFQDQSCEAATSVTTKGCAAFPVLQSLAMFIGESFCLLVIGAMKIKLYLEQRKLTGRQSLLFRSDSAADYSAVSSDDENDESILVSTVRKPTTKPELKGLAGLYLALPSVCDICGTTTMSVGLLLVPASVFQMCR